MTSRNADLSNADSSRMGIACINPSMKGVDIDEWKMLLTQSLWRAISVRCAKIQSAKTQGMKSMAAFRSGTGLCLAQDKIGG